MDLDRNYTMNFKFRFFYFYRIVGVYIYVLTKIKTKFLVVNTIIFANQMKGLLYKFFIIFTLLLYPAVKLSAFVSTNSSTNNCLFSVENRAFITSSANTTSDYILFDNDLFTADDDDDDEVDSSKRKLIIAAFPSPNFLAINLAIFKTSGINLDFNYRAFSHLLPYSDYLSLRVIRI
jgi:hypothetical protein